MIVYTIGNTTLVTDTEDITTEEILEETTKTLPLYYITAVIHASQYRDGYTMQYALGAGDTTTDDYGRSFRNREIKMSTLFFFRVFSISSTPEVCITFMIGSCLHIYAMTITERYFNHNKYANAR